MHSLEDRALSALAIALVAGLGWGMIHPPAAVPILRDLPRPALQLPLPSRVMLVAEAIARSEGYYARGSHDGHSLSYVLNNPGLLKATPLAGGDLPTWNDTGLLIFATPQVGWAALRRQVCTMLTGTSRMYSPADDLQMVGLKYADGDMNWGANVARHLGLPPQTTLANLGAGIPAGVPCLAL